MGVCEHVSRDEARAVPAGKSVKAKCVRNTMGSGECPEIRCRLVAQELGNGERLDDRCAGTPSLPIVKVVLSVAVERDLMLVVGRESRLRVCLDGAPKCTLSYLLRILGSDGRATGKLKKAMRGTLDAPQIWARAVKVEMIGLGCMTSEDHGCGPCGRLLLHRCDGRGIVVVRLSEEEI